MKSRPVVLKHFRQVDPQLYPFLLKVDFDRLSKPVSPTKYFQELCENIIGQQLAGKAADAIYSRFETLMPLKIVSPEHILATQDQALRDVGMSWAKVKYVKDLATQTKNQTLNLKALPDLDNEAVIAELIKVKGIGRWTAEMFLIFSLGREDVFSNGDLGLKRGLEKVYDLKNPKPEQIQKIIKPWSPYKSYGSLALWQSLEK